MAKGPLLGLVFSVILPVTAALAAPATSDEANRLTTLFQRYVGAPAEGQPSAVTVAPEGESYRVTLDLKQALAGLAGLGVTVDPSLSTTMLTPLPDGTWKVTSGDMQPVVMHIRDQSIAIKTASARAEGIYDPRMYAFKTLETQYTGYDYSSTAPTAVQNSHSDTIGVTYSGMPAEGGTVTGSLHETVAGTKVEFLNKAVNPPPSSATGAPAAAAPVVPAFALSYTAPTSSLDVGMEKLHSKNLLDLWAFLVAHPSRDSLAAAQGELRDILRAALPLASALKENASVEGLSLDTPIGVFSAKTGSSGLALDGLDGTAKATFNFVFGGLTVPPGQLPPWSQGLTPTDLSLEIGVDGIHAAEAASEAVNDFDLKSDRPFTPDQTARIGHLAMPGAATVTLMPSRLTSSLLDVKLAGGATLSDEPEGHLTIEATGLDKAIASLQAAANTDPSAAQALGPLVLAKNLAKPGQGGGLSWLVEFKGNGPVTVNGTPLQ